jgi:hypothetical protein
MTVTPRGRATTVAVTNRATNGSTNQITKPSSAEGNGEARAAPATASLARGTTRVNSSPRIKVENAIMSVLMIAANLLTGPARLKSL